MDSRLNVLVVEDSEDDTILLVRELQKGGFLVNHQRVENDQDMRAALNNNWDVIFSDYSVPGFNSHRAFALLKESGQDIPFIIVSGTIGEEAAVAAMKAGVNDYFLKGNLSRLVPALQRELREAAGRRRRRLAEDALREYQERLTLLAQTTNDALWEWNVESRALWWHEGLPRLFGYAANEEIRPSLAFFVERLHPEDRESVLRSLRRLLRPGVRTWSREFRFLRGNGEYAIVFARGTVVRGAEGKPRRIVGSLIEITEKRRMEEQLRQAQKIEAVGRLAGGVAHDFNNLLTAVLGYAEELRREIKESPRAMESLAEIERCVERGASLTRQLLAFSRKQVVRPQALDMNAVVQDISKMLRRMLGDDIELVTLLGAQLGKVKADPGQLEQVLMNLAINGRDAMPRGGKLTLETSNVNLTKDDAAIRAEILPGPYVCLNVTDTGHGMDASILSHLFEPFFTTKEPGHGTGLGLATVYGIIKQARGYVYAESRVGQGTRVRVYLPVLSEQEAAQIPGPRPMKTGLSDAPARGWETVLVVDDDQPVRGFAQRFLARQGYKVLEAATPLEALRLAEANPDIHLLVTDLRMPQMSGRELAEKIAATRPHLRRLYMSGFADSDDMEMAVREDAFLSKPFTGHQLLMRVRETLDRDPDRHPAAEKA